jgi:hypothetical protein
MYIHASECCGYLFAWLPVKFLEKKGLLSSVMCCVWAFREIIALQLINKTLLLYIPEILGSNLSLESGYTD